MGLDMNPMSKPKLGHEDEFRDLFLQLNGRADASAQGLMGKLFGKKPNREDLVSRFQEISLAPYESIGAPVVGKDEIANEWVRHAFRDGRLSNAGSEENAIAQMSGYCALQAMPECDGFPIYTHAYDYEGVDRTSFRGSFLPLCSDVLSSDLIEAAWTSMLAEELENWGQTVGDAAQAFARKHATHEVIGKRSVDFAEDDPATLTHIADSAARWAKYWSSRGHGSEAYF